jgi:hypothetical protein
LVGLEVRDDLLPRRPEIYLLVVHRTAFASTMSSCQSCLSSVTGTEAFSDLSGVSCATLTGCASTELSTSCALIAPTTVVEPPELRRWVILPAFPQVRGLFVRRVSQLTVGRGPWKDRGRTRPRRHGT